MADGKIYIIVTDQLPNGSGPITPDGNQQQNKIKEKKDPLGDYAKHQFFNLVKNQAMQNLNYSISNIGNFTGDYMKQEHVENMMQAGSFVLSLVTSAVAGWKMTGSPWGAVIAVAATGISEGISTAQQYYAGLVENARKNRDIALLKTRAGLNSTNNGSRCT